MAKKTEVQKVQEFRRSFNAVMRLHGRHWDKVYMLTRGLPKTPDLDPYTYDALAVKQAFEALLEAAGAVDKLRKLKL